jgi:hypothetical protein
MSRYCPTIHCEMKFHSSVCVTVQSDMDRESVLYVKTRQGYHFYCRYTEQLKQTTKYRHPSIDMSSAMGA